MRPSSNGRTQSRPKAPTKAARPSPSAPITTRFAGLPDWVAGAEVPEAALLEDESADGVVEVVPLAGVVPPLLLPVVDEVISTSELRLPDELPAKTV